MTLRPVARFGGRGCGWPFAAARASPMALGLAGGRGLGRICAVSDRASTLHHKIH
jgi:hypothetical protein